MYLVYLFLVLWLCDVYNAEAEILGERYYVRLYVCLMAWAVHLSFVVCDVRARPAHDETFRKYVVPPIT